LNISVQITKNIGFQRLKNEITVQSTLENALSIINKKSVTIKGAGRTDRGVHAYDQKITFDLDINIDPKHLKKALNSLVKPYIFVNDAKVVEPSFHARFNVLKKEYIYKINLGEYDPLKKDYYYEPEFKLNIKEMKKCAKLFIGIHNYKNFVSGTRTNYDCIIYNIKFKKKKNILEIKFIGKSFYRYMVRNLVGAMLDVSIKRISLDDIKNALNSPEKEKAFSTAEAQGLYLNKIYYKGEK